MTKQEQIREIAKVMCLFCKEMTEEKDCERGKECFDWRLKEARFYYQQGCRIINKDSVVLTKKEYEVLKVKAKEKHWLKTCIAVWENAKIDASEETAKEIISFIESKDKKCGKYSIYTKLLQELKEKYLEVEE